MEIVGSLGGLTNTAKLMKLQSMTGKRAEQRENGFRNLFGAPVVRLADAKTLADKGVVCIERYFNMLARIYTHDWPKPGRSSNGSAFELTKFIAALIKLLGQFIDEGASWVDVDEELKRILGNVKEMCGAQDYKSVLFKIEDTRLPGTRARISDMYQFLNLNRKDPTPITEILRAK
jgi:hypothetical protein